MQRYDRAYTQPQQQVPEQGEMYCSKGVSAAFRKLLRRVNTQITDLCRKKSPPKTSFSDFHHQQLLKKRKASASLFQKRRPLQIPPERQDGPCNKTELDGRWREKPQDKAFKSVRCHSNPALGNNSKADGHPKQMYEFLQARTYNFEEGLAMRPLKNTKAVPWFSSTQGTPNGSGHGQKIKARQRRKPFSNIVSKTCKLHTSKAFGGWQPWESDKHDQFSFLNH